MNWKVIWRSREWTDYLNIIILFLHYIKVNLSVKSNWFNNLLWLCWSVNVEKQACASTVQSTFRTRSVDPWYDHLEGIRWTVPEEKYWYKYHRNHYFWKCYDDCTAWNIIKIQLSDVRKNESYSPFEVGSWSALVPSGLIQTLQLWHRFKLRGSSFSNLTRWLSLFWN